MIAIVLALIGAALGWHRAGKMGGNRLDRLQYAGIFAIVGFLAGVVLTFTLDWSGLV